MAKRTNAENNQFRTAPRVEPKTPVFTENNETENKAEQETVQSAPETQININPAQLEQILAQYIPQPEPPKEKAKLGRKISIGDGAKNRVISMIDDATNEKLKEYCKKYRYGVSELIRELIIERLEKEEE